MMVPVINFEAAVYRITGMFFFFASLLQYPEVLKLEEELAHVRSAAKVK